MSNACQKVLLITDIVVVIKSLNLMQLYLTISFVIIYRVLKQLLILQLLRVHYLVILRYLNGHNETANTLQRLS